MDRLSEEYIVALYRRARVEWLLRGVLILGLLIGGMVALYLALGPQKWMPVLGFVFATFARGWVRAFPRRRL